MPYQDSLHSKNSIEETLRWPEHNHISYNVPKLIVTSSMDCKIEAKEHQEGNKMPLSAKFIKIERSTLKKRRGRGIKQALKGRPIKTTKLPKQNKFRDNLENNICLIRK